MLKVPAEISFVNDENVVVPEVFDFYRVRDRDKGSCPSRITTFHNVYVHTRVHVFRYYENAFVDPIVE